METNRLIYAKLSETFHLLWHCQFKSASSLILEVASTEVEWNNNTDIIWKMNRKLMPNGIFLGSMGKKHIATAFYYICLG
jgi:hypothetical protein